MLQLHVAKCKVSIMRDLLKDSECVDDWVAAITSNLEETESASYGARLELHVIATADQQLFHCDRKNNALDEKSLT
jgi:hypothetical protein